MREFNDLAHLAKHFLELQAEVQHQAERALDRAAALIEKTAKAEIGHYQPAVGNFPAWPQLAESTLAYHASMGVGDSPLIVTGQLYGSIERETHGPEAIIGTKMDIGAYQEFGTAKIPPRPFMGPAAFVNKAKIEKIMASGMVQGLIGGNALLSQD